MSDRILQFTMPDEMRAQIAKLSPEQQEAFQESLQRGLAQLLPGAVQTIETIQAAASDEEERRILADFVEEIRRSAPQPSV